MFKRCKSYASTFHLDILNIDDIYASIYFIRNMLPLSNAFNHFGRCSIFSSIEWIASCSLFEKKACIFSSVVVFSVPCHCYICIATYVWNVIECCISPVMHCNRFLSCSHVSNPTHERKMHSSIIRLLVFFLSLSCITQSIAITRNDGIATNNVINSYP